MKSEGRHVSLSSDGLTGSPNSLTLCSRSPAQNPRVILAHQTVWHAIQTCHHAVSGFNTMLVAIPV